MIFVHYEQRKVMLSQLHPTESGDPDPNTEPPSELKQVERRKKLRAGAKLSNQLHQHASSP